MRPVRVLPIAVSLGTLVTFLNPATVMVQVLSGQIAVTADEPHGAASVGHLGRSHGSRRRASASAGRAKIRSSTDGPTNVSASTTKTCRCSAVTSRASWIEASPSRSMERPTRTSILDTTAALPHEEATGIIETLSGTALPQSRAPELMILPRTGNG